MTYKELYDKALWDLEHDNMTLGEFDRITEPLNKEIPKEEQTDGDLISRDYEIQQIQKAKESNYNFNYDTLIDFIKVLPSAENTIIRCKDCEWWKKEENNLRGRCYLMQLYSTGQWYCANARLAESEDKE